MTLPPGIGDIIWVAQKLVNANEVFEFHLPDSSPRRGHQVLELLPQLAFSTRYVPDLSYRWVAKHNSANETSQWGRIKRTNVVLSANDHLEEGRRIEDFLPDLKTSFEMNYLTTDEDCERARLIVQDDELVIGLYMSSAMNSAHYGGWTFVEWFYLARFLWWRAKNLGVEVSFALIGAGYDIDMIKTLGDQMAVHKIPFRTVVSLELGTVVEVMKKLHYFISFPSGLAILNETLGKDGTMFYGPHLHRLMKTWASQDRIAANRIHETMFCRPEELYNWLKNTYKIFKYIQ